MKHATRFTRLARQASGAALGIAHGAIIGLGVAAAAQFSKEDAVVSVVSYVATQSDNRVSMVQPALSESDVAVAELQPVRLEVNPSLLSSKAEESVAAEKAAQGLKATRHKTADSLASLSLQNFDPVASESGLSPEMERVRDWIADTYRVSDKVLKPALLAAEESAEKHGFDPLLIVAIMAVESSFNPKAVSHMGAQGLMQVIPRFHQDKIGAGRDKYALFDPALNVRVGTLVLREGVQRYGSLQRALQYYNGSLKDPKARYTRKVMAVKKRLDRASGRTDLAQNDLLAAAS